MADGWTLNMVALPAPEKEAEKETQGKQRIARPQKQPEGEDNLPRTMQNNCTCFIAADRESQLESRSLRERRKFSGREVGL
jgi:hypothetical protein